MGLLGGLRKIGKVAFGGSLLGVPGAIMGAKGKLPGLSTVAGGMMGGAHASMMPGAQPQQGLMGAIQGVSPVARPQGLGALLAQGRQKKPMPGIAPVQPSAPVARPMGMME